MNNIKILIADDSPTVRNMLSSIFKKAGFGIILAADGIEAIKAAYRERPDVILLDIFMPRMNGYQVCRLLKDDVSISSTPVLILTSAEGKREKFWSFETGADEFMVKNFNTSELILNTVEKFAQNYRRTHPKSLKINSGPSDDVEILSRISVLLDKQLYNSTVEKIKLETILSNLVEGLMTLDANKVITSFNPAMENMLAVPAKDILGKKCCDVFSGSLCKEECYFAQAFSSGKDIIDAEFNLMPYNKKGSAGRSKNISILSSISLLRGDDAKIIGAVCLFKDISRIKEAEQIRTDFISMATHELRTPLTIIKASANNILEGITGEVNQEQKNCLEIVKNTSERLLGLTSDLLDLSKFESGVYELNIEKVDMVEIIKRCIAGFTLLCDQKKIAISYSVPQDLSVIYADFNKLEQVLINLISNAVKFTPDGGKINIAIEDRESIIECSVSDTGKGIAEEARNKIFDKFQQIYDKESRQRGGTGLGLSVVKAIIEAHKGKVWVESVLGKGSKFVFTIPKSASA